MTGLPAGENVTIRSVDGDELFTYRSFATVVSLVAMVVAVVVVATGLAAIGFLFAEGRPVPALIAAVLSAAFAVLIAMLVPSTRVTLNHANMPALMIAQQSNVSFPIVTYVVATPEKTVLARISRSAISRLGRNRWKILMAHDDRMAGYAIEESASRAFLRKFAGKFSPRYQSNMQVSYHGKDAGWIVRRPNEKGESDFLDITGDMDHRVAVALATLVLGSEP